MQKKIANKNFCEQENKTHCGNKDEKKKEKSTCETKTAFYRNQVLVRKQKTFLFLLF